MLPHAAEVQFTPGQIRAYQHLLTSLGFPTPIDGVWTQATVDAVTAYQRGRPPADRPA